MEPFVNCGIVTFGHVDVLQLIEQGVVTRRYCNNAFKFGFVRNPFDRTVSLFSYLKKISCEEVPDEMTFQEFCRKVEQREHPPLGRSKSQKSGSFSVLQNGSDGLGSGAGVQ